jgi:hypothetical protein
MTVMIFMEQKIKAKKAHISRPKQKTPVRSTREFLKCYFSVFISMTEF